MAKELRMKDLVDPNWVSEVTVTVEGKTPAEMREGSIPSSIKQYTPKQPNPQGIHRHVKVPPTVHHTPVTLTWPKPLPTHCTYCGRGEIRRTLETNTDLTTGIDYPICYIKCMICGKRETIESTLEGGDA